MYLCIRDYLRPNIWFVVHHALFSIRVCYVYPVVSGQNQVVTTFFPTIGGSKCKTERIGITMTEEKWNQSLSDQESTYFKNLESKILMAVSKSFEIKVAVFTVTFTKACILNVYFL